MNQISAEVKNRVNKFHLKTDLESEWSIARPHRKKNASFTLQFHTLLDVFFALSHQIFICCFALFSTLLLSCIAHKIINQNNENVQRRGKVLSFAEPRSGLLLLLLQESASVCDDPLFENDHSCARKMLSDFFSVYAPLTGE